MVPFQTYLDDTQRLFIKYLKKRKLSINLCKKNITYIQESNFTTYMFQRWLMEGEK